MVLVARKDPKRRSAYAVRWLRRLLEERPTTIDEAAMVAACLRALGGSGHDAACAALYGLFEHASDRQVADL